MKAKTKKLLLQAKADILAHPRQFLMEDFFGEYDSKGDVPVNCGTAACIAGWIMIRKLGGTPAEVADAIGECWGALKAKRVLGITEKQSNRLFFPCGWPNRFWRAYENAKTQRGAARAAAKRIDHFIKTNGKE